MVKLELKHEIVCQRCPHFDAVVEKYWEGDECITLVKCKEYGCKYMMDYACEVAAAAAIPPECDL